MQQSKPKPRKASKGEWIFAFILGIVFLTWFFSTRDTRTPEERVIDEVSETATQMRIDAKVSAVRQNRYASLISGVKQELSDYDIICTNVEVAESGCLWVYIADNGKNRDGLAKTLCYRAKKDFVRCVTIFDTQGNTQGRSICK